MALRKHPHGNPSETKTKVGKKKVINTTPKKRHEHSLLRWLADVKKKSGLSMRKLEVGRVRWKNA
jgi:hypothetical protein